MYEAEKSLALTNVDQDIKAIINKCLDHLKMKNGCCIEDYKFDMRETCEMSASLFYKMESIPNVLKDPVTNQVWDLINKHICVGINSNQFCRKQIIYI